MRIGFLAVILLTLHFMPSPCRAETFPLTFLTEENPPFHFTENGVLKGMAVEILYRIWENTGEPRREITVMPWTRAYEAAQNTPGAVIFVTARLPEREKLFKWVGPITMSRLVLLTTRGNTIKLKSDDDIKKYRIGVLNNDVAELIMRKLGVPDEKLDMAPDHKSSVLKLMAGRIDMMVKGEKSLNEFLKGIGQNPEDFRVLRKVAGVQVCYAFNKDTPDRVIKRYQGALNALKADGTLNRIIKRYQPD
ncbi:MAG: transporter substrate-binding domain-containing protein [Desulfuromonadaceae bacterium]|nr:transporter substrate-binding domain-containing protein [Desulfuromonadaceae bacterium]